MFKAGDQRYMRHYDRLGYPAPRREWDLLTFGHNDLFYDTDGCTWKYGTEVEDEDLFTFEEYEKYCDFQEKVV
jgi:hypothetical protein